MLPRLRRGDRPHNHPFFSDFLTLKQDRIEPSMSQGKLLGFNAVAESFFSILKKERIKK